MANDSGQGRPSEILRLAELLNDPERLSAVGSRMIRRQIEGFAKDQLRDPGAVQWYDEWENMGNIWSNWVDTDEWVDAKGNPGRLPFAGQPELRLRRNLGGASRGLMTGASSGMTRSTPEMLFNDEELRVLRDLKIID
jgi:hypothetical protein